MISTAIRKRGTWVGTFIKFGIPAIFAAGVLFACWTTASHRTTAMVGLMFSVFVYIILRQYVDQAKRDDAEQALRDSALLLRSGFNAVSAHIAILDQRGVIITVNAAWNRFAQKNGFLGNGFGIGTNYIELCQSAGGKCAQEAPTVAEGIRNVADGRRNEFQLEYPCHSPHEQRWFEVRITRFGSEGSARLIVIHENITVRKQLEESLLRKTALLEAQVNSSLDGILVVDDSGMKRLQNQQMTALLKIPKAIADSNDDKRQLNWVSENVKNPEQFLERIRYLDSHPNEISRDEMELKDGTVLDRYSTPLVGADGKSYGKMTTFRDITEYKQLEERLRRNSQRLQMLWQAVEQSPASIIITDIHGIIKYVNPKFTELTGYSSEEALGQNPRILKSGEMSAAAYLELWNIIRAGNNWRGELCNRKKDGSLYWESASISPVKDETGAITNYLAIKENISERKQAEAKLLETNQRLIEATAQAKDMILRAKKADQAKSEFLATMSHEIRTPMNGVIGLTGLLLDTPLDETQLRYVNTVRASGEALMSLINDILDFSKIEAGKLDLETLDFDLLALLDDLVALLAHRAEEKHLEFVCTTDVAVPNQLRGDPGRLRQVLLNLAGNAVKFTKEGKITVQVSLASEIEADVIIRFSVKDTGIGIQKEKQNLLFQAFTQANSSITRQYGGTGLGLAISKQLVEMMGGQIGLSSEEGKGSEFWFTVRFGRTLLRESSIPQPREIQPAARVTPPRPARILVVEDNSTNQMVIVGILAKFGYPRVDAVANGVEALNALENFPYDLVFMDVQMPEMDGLEATKRIRESGTQVLNPKVPVIAMTAHAMQSDRANCFAAGMNDYVTKPVMPHTLKAALDKWLLVEADRADLNPSTIQPKELNDGSAPIFDRAGLLNRMMNDLELASGVAWNFLQETPAILSALQEYIERGEITHAIATAHGLKGSAANVNGYAMQNAAYQVELAGKANDLSKMRALLPNLHQQFTQLASAIQEQLLTQT